MSSVNSESNVRRITIPGPSWQSTFYWWTQRIGKPFRHFLSSTISPIPVPLKGQQAWAFPPDERLVNRHVEGHCTPGQWKDERSGWTMTTLLPPGKKAKTETSRCILYFHGSGWQVPIIPWHWSFGGYLAHKLDAEVIVVPYPLAPTNIAQEVNPILLKLYESFLERSGDRETIIAGDSAGAQLALATIFLASSAPPPLSLPSQLVAISPPVNMAMDNEQGMNAIAPYDIDLTPEFAALAPRVWFGLPPLSPAEEGKGKLAPTPIPRELLDNPTYNPGVGDLAPLLARAGTRLIVTSGTWDILHADIDTWVRTKLDGQGGAEVTYIVGEKMYHIFPVSVDVCPESRMGAEMIVTSIIANGPRR